MARALTPAQRRAVAGSDPATGRLAARADVCAALAAAGLAVRHGRGGHHSYYLTAEGMRLRAEWAVASAPAAAPEPPAPGGGFTADDGTGTAPPGGPRRAAEVAAAWEGLLQIRAVLLDGATGVPAPWERERPVHAVALALEAAGCPPATTSTGGYAVTVSAQDDAMAEVSWRGAPTPADAADALTRCAQLLAARGWQSTHHRTRHSIPYLLTTPRRTTA